MLTLEQILKVARLKLQVSSRSPSFRCKHKESDRPRSVMKLGYHPKTGEYCYYRVFKK